MCAKQNYRFLIIIHWKSNGSPLEVSLLMIHVIIHRDSMSINNSRNVDLLSIKAS